jgi:hypothetical protein
MYNDLAIQRIMVFNGKHRTNLSTRFQAARQAGGGNLGARSCTIKVWTQRNLDGNVLNVFGGLSPSSYPCFNIHFNPITRVAQLEELSNRRRGHGCIQCTDLSDYDDASKIMIDMILQYCNEKKATCLELMDMSHKPCDDVGGEKFQLMNMYFLAHSMTWYEAYIPGLRPVKDLTPMRKIIQTRKWSDVEAVMRLRNEWDGFLALVKGGEIPLEIRVNEEGSAMAVFRWLKDTRQCNLFVKYMGGFLAGAGIESLLGTTWVKEF